MGARAAPPDPGRAQARPHCAPFHEHPFHEHQDIPHNVLTADVTAADAAAPDLCRARVVWLALFLAAHLLVFSALSSGWRWRGGWQAAPPPRPAGRGGQQPSGSDARQQPDADAAAVGAQLAIYERGWQCEIQFLEELRPLARTQRRCPGGVLHALTAGARPGWDEPFAFPPHCALKWYQPGEACALLRRMGALFAVGDSLTRHLFQSLWAVASGDYARGSTVWPAAAPCEQLCFCGGQFRDGSDDACSRGECPREASGAFWGDSHPQSMLCPDWRGPGSGDALPFASGVGGSERHVHFKFAVGTPETFPDAPLNWQFHVDELRSMLPAALVSAAEAAAASPARQHAALSGVTVFMAPPVHHIGFTPDRRAAIVDGFITPVFEAMALMGADNATLAAVPRRVVCGGLPARQANKPEYLETQGNQHVIPYNAWLRSTCAAAAAAVAPARPGASPPRAAVQYLGFWQAYEFTLNRTSIDGAHYQLDVNIPLAQVLLNALDEGTGGGGYL